MLVDTACRLPADDWCASICLINARADPHHERAVDKTYNVATGCGNAEIRSRATIQDIPTRPHRQRIIAAKAISAIARMCWPSALWVTFAKRTAFEQQGQEALEVDGSGGVPEASLRVGLNQ